MVPAPLAMADITMADITGCWPALHVATGDPEIGDDELTEQGADRAVAEVQALRTPRLCEPVLERRPNVGVARDQA